MSKQWHHPARNDRTIRNGSFAYTDRHPSDRRLRAWHIVPLVAFVGLIAWGLS